MPSYYPIIEVHEQGSTQSNQISFDSWVRIELGQVHWVSGWEGHVISLPHHRWQWEPLLDKSLTKWNLDSIFWKEETALLLAISKDIWINNGTELVENQSEMKNIIISNLMEERFYWPKTDLSETESFPMTLIMAPLIILRSALLVCTILAYSGLLVHTIAKFAVFGNFFCLVGPNADTKGWSAH